MYTDARHPEIINKGGITDILLLPTPTPSQYANAKSCVKKKDFAWMSLLKSWAVGPVVLGLYCSLFAASMQNVAHVRLQICVC
jgi:hypothetical protein